MSTTIDNKIVEMSFNNSDFEKNAQQSIETTEKLKKSMNFDGVGKGLEEVGKAAKNCDVGALATAAESVGEKFDAMKYIAIYALQDIYNMATRTASQLVNLFAIQPVSSGFEEYELKMNSVQTIMNSSGENLSTVNGYLDELNTYADQTIYSFADMTQNIGKFTNAGVSLDKAVAAIKGISNEAAVSGANTNEASRAMYNFAQALSAGYVKLIDWKSIESANMATVEFRQELIDTAAELGTLEQQADGTYKVLSESATGSTMDEAISATQNFNDSLSYQWMTTDVLVETLNRYADATTDIGQKAYASATEVKTFSMMMDALTESAGSGWTETWELIVGDFQEAKVFWTDLTNYFGAIIGTMNDSRNNLLKGGLENGFDLIENKVKNAGITVDDFENKIKELGSASGVAVDDIINECGSMGEAFAQGKLSTDLITQAISDLGPSAGLSEKAIEQLNKAASGMFDNLEARSGRTLLQESLFNILNTIKTIGSTVSEAWNNSVEGLTSSKIYSAIEAINIATTNLKNYITDHADQIKRTLSGVFKLGSAIAKNVMAVVKGVIGVLANLFGMVTGNAPDILNITANIGDFFSKLADGLDVANEITAFFDNLIDKLPELINQLKELPVIGELFKIDTGSIFEQIKNFGNSAVETLLETIAYVKEHGIQGVVDIFNGIKETIAGKAGEFGSSIQGPAENIVNKIKEFLDKVGNAAVAIAPIVGSFMVLKGVADTITSFAKAIETLAAPLQNANKILESTGAFIDELKNQVKSCGKALSFAIKTEAFINIAIAVGIIALAIAGLAGVAAMNPAALIGAVIAVGLIIAALVGVMIYASKLSEDDIAKLQVVSKMMLSIAAVVGILGALVVVFANMDTGTLIQGLIGLGVVLGLLAAFFVIVTKLGASADVTVTATFNKFAQIILSIGASFLMISYGIRLMATCNVEQLALGAVIFGAFAVLIAVLMVCMYKISADAARATVFGNLLVKVSKTILMVGQAFALIAVGIFLIGQLSEEQLNRAMSVIGKVIVFFGVFIVMLSFAQSISQGQVMQFSASILAVVGAIAIMTLLAIALSYVDPLAFLRGLALLAAVSAVVVAIYGVMAFVTSKLGVSKLTSMGLSLFAMTVSIGLMAAIAVLLGYCDPVKLSQGIVFVGILATFASMLAWAASFLKKEDIASITTLAACVAVLAVIAVAFTLLDQSKLATSVAALDSLMLCFGIFAKMMTSLNDTKIPIGKVALMLGVIAVLAGIIAALCAINGTEKAASVGSAIAETLIAFGVVLVVLNELAEKTTSAKTQLTSMLPTIGVAILIMAACGLLIAAVCNLSGDQVDKAVEVAGAVSLLMLSLTACTYGLSAIGNTGINASVLKTMGVLLGALVIVAAVIVIMVNLIGDRILQAYAVAGALSLMLGVLTGCAIALSKFGGMRIDETCYHAILAMSVALIPIGIVIGLLCAFAGDSLQYSYTAAMALSLTIAALSGCALALSKWSGFNLNKGIVGTMAVLSLCLIPIGVVIGYMCLNIGDKANAALPIAKALVIVMAALAGVTVALSLIKTNKIDASIIVTMGVLGACMAAMGLVLGYVINSIGANASAAVPIAAALAVAIVGLASAAVILSGYHGTLLAGLKGVVVLDALIVSLIGILALLGGLNKFTDGAVVKGVQVIMDIIETVAEGIGKIVMGIGVGMSESLVQITTNISIAMMLANVACAAVDEQNLSKIKTFGEALAALGKGQIIEGIGNLVGMKMTDVVKVLGQLGQGVREFADQISGVDVTTVEQGANAAKALCEGLSAIPMEGGVFDKLFGEHNYDKFAEGVKSVAKALPVFVEAVGDINVDTVQPSCEALATVIQTFSNIENTGGLLQDLLGGKDYSEFASGLESIGQSLPKYVAAVGDTSTENVQPSADALKYLLEVLKDMPTEGGWISGITGGNIDIEKFSSVLPNLGTAFKDYCTNVTGAAFKSGHDAATNLSIVVNTLKNMKESGVDSSSVSGFANAVKALTDIDMEKLKSMYGGSDSGTVFSKIAETISTGIDDALKSINFTSAGQTLNAKLIEGLNTAFSTDSSGNLHKMISEVAQSLYNGESTSSFRTIGVNLANMFKMGLQEGMKSTDSSAASIEPLVIAVSTTASQKFKTLGVNSATWFNEGFKQIMQSGDSVSGQFNTLCSTLYSTYGLRFHTLGINLVSMLKDGFKMGLSGFNGLFDEVILEMGNTHGATMKAIGANLASTFRDGWNVSMAEVGSLDLTLNSLYRSISSYSNQFKALGANLAGFFKDGVNYGFGQLSDNVYEGIQSIYTNNATSIYTVGVNLGSAFKDGIVKSFSFTDSFTNGFESLYNSISNYDVKFLTLGVNAANWFKNGFNTTLNDTGSMTSSFSAMYLNLSGYMSHFYTLGINLVSMLKDGFKMGLSGFNGLFDEVILEMGNTHGATMKAIGANLASTFKDGWNVSMAEVGSLDLTLNSLYRSISSYSNQFKALGANLAGFFKDGINYGFGQLSDNVYEGIQSIYTNNATSIYTVGVNLGSAFKDGMRSSLADVTSSIDSIVASLWSMTPSFTAAGANAMGAYASGMIASVSLAAGHATEAASNALNALNNYAPFFSAPGTNAMFWYGLGIAIATTDANAGVTVVLNNIIQTLTDAASKFTTEGEKHSIDYAEGLESGADNAYNAALWVLAAACVGISTSTGTFFSAGLNAAYGFANGISAGSFAAVISARAMANAAASAAKVALAEHSPSKVFEQIGNYGGQGLAIGFDNTQNLVRESGTNLALSAVDGISDGLSDLNAAIIPTIDYASLATNTGKLDFSATMNRLISEPVRSSVDVMNDIGKEIKSSNNDVISAISDISKPSYTIEGITYDDGSAVARAISDITRYANIAKRR